MSGKIFDIISNDRVATDPDYYEKVFSDREAWFQNHRDRKELSIIKNWLNDNPHLPRMSDQYILIFLNSREFNLEETKTLIDKYFEIRSTTPELFTKRHPQDDIYNSFNQVYFVCVPFLNKNGERIMLYGIQEHDGAPDIKSWLKSGVANIDVQIAQCCPSNGVQVIYDGKGFQMKHIALSALPLLRKSLQFTQECMPSKLRGVHIINIHPAVYYMYNLIKPLLIKRITNLIHFYTEDKMEEFYEAVGKENLPSDYGGKLPSKEKLHWENFNRMVEVADYLKDMEHFVINDDLKNTKYSQGSIKRIIEFD